MNQARGTYRHRAFSIIYGLENTTVLRPRVLFENVRCPFWLGTEDCDIIAQNPTHSPQYTLATPQSLHTGLQSQSADSPVYSTRHRPQPTLACVF